MKITHYLYNAFVVEEGATKVAIDPRGKELTSWIPFDNLHPLDVGDSIELDDVTSEAVRTVHGPIEVSLLGFKIRKTPGPGERTGLGAIGFNISIGEKTVLNLGDSLLLDDWDGLQPTVLMIPIGGLGQNTWTMDVDEALQAVEQIDPEVVIPTHYNVQFLWKRRIAVADDQKFKRRAEALDKECVVLGAGDSVTV